MTSFKLNLAALTPRRSTSSRRSPRCSPCADIRVPVEIVFDQSIGSLFVTPRRRQHRHDREIASLEYGAAELGPVIMVLAHQGCGAVKAAIGGGAEPGEIRALYAPLQAAVAEAITTRSTAKLNAKIRPEFSAPPPRCSPRRSPRAS